jgi:DNA-binding GntR family transcriptional regulator
MATLDKEPCMPIARRLLRDEARAELVRKIFAGDFIPGEKLNEAELAEQLAVSRTPVREALALLAQEGVLESLPGRGFVLPPITATEVREVYPLIAALEELAVRNSNPEDLARLVPALDEVCERMLSTAGTVGVQGLDDQWHTTLCSLDENQHLHDAIAGFKRHVHRYELAVYKNEKNVQESVREHRAIMAALVARDLAGAIALLQVNWMAGIERLLRWMSSEGQQQL